MKEATGELSTTMIAVVAIAAVLTLFTVVLLPYLKSSIASRMHCTDAYGCINCANGKCECTYDTDTGGQATVRCTDPNHDGGNGQQQQP